MLSSSTARPGDLLRPTLDIPEAITAERRRTDELADQQLARAPASTPPAEERVLPSRTRSSAGGAGGAWSSVEAPACRAVGLGGAQTHHGMEGEPVKVPGRRPGIGGAVGCGEPVPATRGYLMPGSARGRCR